MEMCREIAGEAVWALGMGVDQVGQRQWEVYCEDPELAKMLPTEFGGNYIHVIVATRPTEEQVREAKRKEKEEEQREKRRWLKEFRKKKKKRR